MAIVYPGDFHTFPHKKVLHQWYFQPFYHYHCPFKTVFMTMIFPRVFLTFPHKKSVATVVFSTFLPLPLSPQNSAHGNDLSRGFSHFSPQKNVEPHCANNNLSFNQWHLEPNGFSCCGHFMSFPIQNGFPYCCGHLMSFQTQKSPPQKNIFPCQKPAKELLRPLPVCIPPGLFFSGHP